MGSGRSWLLACLYGYPYRTFMLLCDGTHTTMSQMSRYSSYFMARCLTELRTRAGLSQTEVAERLGVRQATVSAWETGDCGPACAAIGG